MQQFKYYVGYNKIQVNGRRSGYFKKN